MTKKAVATTAEKQLASMRENMEDRLRGLGGGGGVPTIRLDNRNFILPDEEIVPQELEVVILDWGLFNAFYPPEKPFVRGQPSFPDCFAVGSTVAEMVPSPNSPNIQNNGNPCATCWANKFGSHKNGKAKACQNRVTLGILLYDEGEEGDLYKVSVSPTATTGFREYVQKLAEKNLLPVQVVTRLGFNPKTRYDQLTFSASMSSKEPEFRDYIDAYVARIPEATEAVMREPQPPAEEDEG